MFIISQNIMNIQEASKQTGISKDMIRFYEKKGLIHPKRSENHYRDYSIHDLHLLILIKQYNSLGIPLSTIQSMFLNQNYQEATNQFSKQIDQLRQDAEWAYVKYKKKNELVAFAGLDPRISESGQNDGDHMHITKKGNKRLRCLLYLAVTCSIRLKRDDNSIKDFYVKKKQQSNPMCSKAAKTACASKLVRIIYSMCKTGELYQYNK